MNGNQTIKEKKRKEKMVNKIKLITEGYLAKIALMFVTVFFDSGKSSFVSITLSEVVL